MIYSCNTHLKTLHYFFIMIAYCEVSMRLFVNISFIVNGSCSYERPPKEMGSLCLGLPEHDHWGYQKSANLLTFFSSQIHKKFLPNFTVYSGTKNCCLDFPNTSQHFWKIKKNYFFHFRDGLHGIVPGAALT